MIAEKRHISKWYRSHGEPAAQLPPVVDDWVAREINLTLHLNGNRLVSIASSPIDCKDLAIGYLFTEQIIQSLGDIDFVTFDPVNYEMDINVPKQSDFDRAAWSERRSLSSGCGGGSSSRMEYRKQTLRQLAGIAGRSVLSIYSLIDYVKTISEWHTKTGCIHIGILALNDKVIIREDIGRHNTIDKVIGAGLICDSDFSSAIIYCSGRASSDMVIKTAQAGISVIASRSAPTSLAIDIARETGLTLIGFARGKRFNIYSNPDNIRNDLIAETPVFEGCASQPKANML